MCHASEAKKSEFQNGCCKNGSFCNQNITFELPPPGPQSKISKIADQRQFHDAASLSRFFIKPRPTDIHCRGYPLGPPLARLGRSAFLVATLFQEGECMHTLLVLLLHS